MTSFLFYQPPRSLFYQPPHKMSRRICSVWHFDYVEMDHRHIPIMLVQTHSTRDLRLAEKAAYAAHMPVYVPDYAEEYDSLSLSSTYECPLPLRMFRRRKWWRFYSCPDSFYYALDEPDTVPLD